MDSRFSAKGRTELVDIQFSRYTALGMPSLYKKGLQHSKPVTLRKKFKIFYKELAPGSIRGQSH
jgi:hypothetical protein